VGPFLTFSEDEKHLATDSHAHIDPNLKSQPATIWHQNMRRVKATSNPGGGLDVRHTVAVDTSTVLLGLLAHPGCGSCPQDQYTVKRAQLTSKQSIFKQVRRSYCIDG
jgi:hypothetical protein